MGREHLATVETLMSAVRASHRGDATGTRSHLSAVPPGSLLPGLLVLVESSIELTARTAHVSWEAAADTTTTVLLDALFAAEDEPT